MIKINIALAKYHNCLLDVLVVASEPVISSYISKSDMLQTLRVININCCVLDFQRAINLYKTHINSLEPLTVCDRNQ